VLYTPHYQSVYLHFFPQSTCLTIINVLLYIYLHMHLSFYLYISAPNKCSKFTHVFQWKPESVVFNPKSISEWKRTNDVCPILIKTHLGPPLHVLKQNSAWQFNILRAFTIKTLKRRFLKDSWKTQIKAACSTHVLGCSKTGCDPNWSQERLQRALRGYIASRWRLKVILLPVVFPLRGE